jgi:membrane protein insertase Oxa1/YidC/SpoIIIJ
LIIHLTPNKNFMKEMFKELYKVHKEEPRELWEGVLVVICIFGLFYFLITIFH